MWNREVWFFLFIFGTFLFNWPFLEIFYPSLPFYLFGVWALFIVIVKLFIGKTDKQGAGDV